MKDKCHFISNMMLLAFLVRALTRAHLEYAQTSTHANTAHARTHHCMHTSICASRALARRVLWLGMSVLCRCISAALSILSAADTGDVNTSLGSVW